jgi:hypothetical protein
VGVVKVTESDLICVVAGRRLMIPLEDIHHPARPSALRPLQIVVLAVSEDFASREGLP